MREVRVGQFLEIVGLEGLLVVLVAISDGMRTSMVGVGDLHGAWIRNLKVGEEMLGSVQVTVHNYFIYIIDVAMILIVVFMMFWVGQGEECTVHYPLSCQVNQVETVYPVVNETFVSSLSYYFTAGNNLTFEIDNSLFNATPFVMQVLQQPIANDGFTLMNAISLH
jgi:hypothetical protein